MQALKWIGYGAAGLVLLILLFIAAEDWRGEAAWDQCQREAKKDGLDLDWKSCVPQPVPDDQNFFKAPKMQEWFQKPDPKQAFAPELWNNISLKNAIVPRNLRAEGVRQALKQVDSLKL